MKRGIRFTAKAGKWICRVTALLLIAVMLAGIAPQGQTTAEAAKTKQRTIGIVFDNSGSMYASGALEWCRAIYAMEVFASMANDGDEIIIYPMSEIEVNGETYTSSNPLKILVGTDDPSIIRDIYTPYAGGTPIETIDDAYYGIQSSSGEEKWLIVLTDGATFHMDIDGETKELTQEETEDELSEKLSDYSEKMNVLYMGIGTDAVEPDVSGGAGYVSEVEIVEDSEEVLETLTDMCNTIYGRDSIDDVSGKKVTFDVSMSKLILFVQGDNISGLKVYDADGNEVSMSTDPYTPRYGEQFCGNGKIGGNSAKYYTTTGIDTTLSGTIATYADLDAGTYTFTYSGDVTSVAVYYEPDVTLVARLTDEDGNSVDSEEAITAGTYYLEYALVDKDGNETTSKLLGDREFTVSYTIDGDTTTVTENDNGKVKVELTEDADISASVTAKYLDNYVLSVTSEDGTISMPTHVEPAPAYALVLSVSGGESTYPALELEDEAVYTVTASYNGEKLTGDALASVDLTAALNDTGSTAPTVECELSSDQASYTVSLKYPSGGANALEAKEYTLTLNAAYVEELGREVTADAVKKTFTVEAYDYGLAATMNVSGYYSILEMNSEDGTTITVKVTRDGEALTAEEMEQTELEFSTGGIPYTVEKDTEKSRFIVTLSGENEDGGNIETGDYTITATVTGVDELGNAVSTTVTKDTSVGLLPGWIIVLIILLVILLIALLIFLFMNMKVLPKKITVDEDASRYRVNGVTNDSAIETSLYKGGGFLGKKESSIQFSAPDTAAYPTASCDITLVLKAVSPRWVKSEKRRVKVMDATPNAATMPTRAEVGAATFRLRDGQLVSTDGNNTPITDIASMDVTLRGSSECRVVAPAVYEPFEYPTVDLKVSMRFE